MRFRIWFGVVAAMFVWTASVRAEEDKDIDRDQVTGVVVAPGARTWMSDNFANKMQLIGDIAVSQGKACMDHYAFLGWGIGHGGPAVIVAKTRESYEKTGYAVEQRKGSIATDTIWIVRNDAREAVILWGDVNGSTIYLSCITTGDAAAEPK